MKNEKTNENKDIFFRQNYEFLVQYNINSKVLKVLKENFKIREILIIEEKEEDVVSKKAQ